MSTLELNDFGKKLFEAATSTTGLGGFAARSAVLHLERACQLLETMPEVAVFLAITAQEESAVCVFHGLTKNKYENANKLKRGDHKHKIGVYPFLKFIQDVVMNDSGINVRLDFAIKKHGKKTKSILRTVIPLNDKLGVFPDPPVNIFSVDPDGNETDYHHEIKKLASAKGIKSVFDYIKGLANIRNTVLYASPSAMPKISNAEKVVCDHAEAVVCNFVAYLLIEPYPKQKLVQEALKAYIKVLNRID